MAQTLEQIAVDIQNKLAAIQVCTCNTEANTLLLGGKLDAILNRVNVLISVDQTGFANLSQGISEMIKQQFATNQQLKHNNEQNDIIICWLKIMAKLLCDILRRLEASHEVQEKIAMCLCIVKDILELVHGTEAVEVAKHRDLKKRIEECCPPEKPEPEPCFTPCPTPGDPPRIPDPKYDPLPRPEQPPTPEG